MVKFSKDQKWLTFGFLLIVLTGATLTYATTIGPGGGYDTPWWNASVGLSAPGVDTGQGLNELYAMDQDLESSDAVSFITVDTGQGANDLWDMDQNVQSTDDVDFGTVDTGQGNNELYAMNQDVESSDAVSFITVNTGQGANDLWDMDQNVETTSPVEFQGIDVGWIRLDGDNQTSWPAGGGGSGVMASDWIIVGDSADYTAFESDGTNFTTTSFSQTANWVMGNLTGTSPNTVYFRGTFNLDTAPISVPDYAVLDGYGAEIDLTGNIAAIFQNENMGSARSDFVIIRGFKLDGNKAARTSGTGIEGTFWNSKIYDNIIVEMEEYGIDLRSYTSTNKAVCNINNNWIGSGTTGAGNKGGGLRLGYNGYPTPDCIINENFFINNGNWQIIIEQGAVHRISSNHFAGYADAGDNIAGGIYAGEWNGGAGDSDVDQVGIYSNHFEQHQKQGIYVNSSTGAFSDMWRIQGNDFFDIGNRDANNTYSVIHLHSNGGSTRFGSITGNTGAAIAGGGTLKATYFIELEGANTDYFLINSNVIQSGGAAPSWIDYVDGGGTSELGANMNID